jgi:GAF domain-containing protein
MTPFSTLDRPTQGTGLESAKVQGEGNPAQTVELGQQTRSSQPGVAAAVAAATVRFPGDDGGNSLAEMAQRDLDAALQLLADRAQFITGANGAAIALRRDGKNDMQCRASTGENVPGLGALLSTEFGISGESVRTRKPLRCDDAERDPRVNREGCRQLGIASVVVMPVVNDDEVLGVFELFSGKVNAFGERDLSALRRLSEMVETAVRLARAAENLSQPLLAHDEMLQSQDPVVLVESESVSQSNLSVRQVLTEPALAVSVSAPLEQPAPAPVATLPKKPLFWFAALSPVADSGKPAEADQSHVPPMLRNLRMCEACGFPVSVGRSLCVECE